GIPDYVPLVVPASFDDWTARLRAWRPEELVQRALTQPPAFPPGQGFEYSSTNYIVAGMLVEKLTAHPLEQELRERVFWPADLQDTSFPTADPFVRRPRSLG